MMNMKAAPMNGEYTVVFPTRPLNLALVPSSQLYGVWQVSQLMVPHETIETEDVLLSINGDKSLASLKSKEFTTMIQTIEFPLTICFRKPKLYVLSDSHSTSTAMFPVSGEYRRAFHQDRDVKVWKTRVSAEQWRSVINRDMNRPKSTVQDISDLHPFFSSLRQIFNMEEKSDKEQMDIPVNEKGEYEYVFEDPTLPLTLAPSTRIYGTMEVWKLIKGDLQPIEPGDVIMAFNGDPSAARWSIHDCHTIIRESKTPFQIRFRKPKIYYRYVLQLMDKSKKTVNSKCISHALFPDSAEYHQSSKLHRHPEKKNDAFDRKQIELFKQQILVQKEKEARFKLPFQDDHGAASTLLSVGEVEFITHHFPQVLQCSKLQRRYYSQQDGYNLSTFYTRMKNTGPSILVIKDIEGNRFGAFVTSTWHHANENYGNGNCFVFQLYPKKKVFKWTQKNNDFQFGGKSFLVVGGGVGVAICLEDDLTRGFSENCETFGNPCLSNQQDYIIQSIEAWSFSGIKV